MCFEEVPRVWCWGAPTIYHCVPLFRDFRSSGITWGQRQTRMKGLCCGQLGNGVYSAPYRAPGIKIDALLRQHSPDTWWRPPPHPHSPPLFCCALLWSPRGSEALASSLSSTPTKSQATEPTQLPWSEQAIPRLLSNGKKECACWGRGRGRVDFSGGGFVSRLRPGWPGASAPQMERAVQCEMGGWWVTLHKLCCPLLDTPVLEHTSLCGPIL